VTFDAGYPGYNFYDTRSAAVAALEIQICLLGIRNDDATSSDLTYCLNRFNRSRVDHAQNSVSFINLHFKCAFLRFIGENNDSLDEFVFYSRCRGFKKEEAVIDGAFLLEKCYKCS
jgi:hypothetical protein